MRLSALCALALFACNGPDGGDPNTGTPGGDPGVGNPGAGLSTGTPTGEGTGTPVGEPTFPIPVGWQRVDLNGGAAQASVDAAIADDGTIYVSWVANADVFVSRSTDGGTTWETPVQVDGPGIEPLVAPGRNPYVHVSADTVYVTFAPVGSQAVHLYRSDLGTLSFTSIPISLGAAEFIDYPKVATDANGDAWVTWLSYLNQDIWPTVARESNGFATEEAGNLATLPCECCRNDLFFTSSGAGILLFRNNDVPYRDIWSMRAAPGAANFSQSIQVSRTGWLSFTCPMQGPRMAELGNGDLIAAWTDPTAGPWQVWTVKSTDDGVTWSGDTRAAPAVTGDQRTPAIAADGTSVWLTFSADNGYTLLESSDSGGSFTEIEALNAGATNITEPQVEAGAGIALVVGANAAGEVVLERLQ